MWAPMSEQNSKSLGCVPLRKIDIKQAKCKTADKQASMKANEQTARMIVSIKVRNHASKVKNKQTSKRKKARNRKAGKQASSLQECLHASKELRSKALGMQVSR